MRNAPAASRAGYGRREHRALLVPPGRADGAAANLAIRLLERAEAQPGRDRPRMVVMGARFARGRLLAGSAGSALARGEVERVQSYRPALSSSCVSLMVRIANPNLVFTSVTI